jgi:murein DD-endopeptidase MepM/ murein hydrolase activator NlpD
MKRFPYALILLLTLSVLTASCAAKDVWLPPSAPPTSPPALALVFEGGVPDLLKDNAAEADSGEAETHPPPVQPTENAPVEDQVQSPTATPVLLPTPTDTPQVELVNSAPFLYYAQAADTLPVVATRFGVDPDEITSREPIPESAYLTPGQLLVIPRRLTETTSPHHTMPDSEVVFSPSATDFDVESFVSQAGGKLSEYTQWLESTGVNSGAQIVERVAIENSINPRLLLAMLEFQSGWVYGHPEDQQNVEYPMGHVERYEDGLYHQLVWAVNQLSIGYYAYREGRMTDIGYPDGSTIRLSPDLNAGSAALQYYYAQHYSGTQWEGAIDTDLGLPALYTRMYGDPWQRAEMVEPLFPRGLEQPSLTLPIPRGETWAYTGGPHGAWERDGAFAALDFAPGATQPGCVKSNRWAIAAASGLVVRSNNGVVALDLDGDGREQTGWVLIYLHLEEDGRVPNGSWVDAGDNLGHPSCEGGISTGTHLHIARKFNGEWIPADGPLPFNLGGWIAHAGQEPYKGTLTRDGETITACTCANAASFVTRGEDDP